MSDTNPYLEARREWNDRYADLSRGTRNWQIVAAAALAADLILAAGIVWLAERRVVVPYVVAVDKLGYALAAGAAKRDDEALAADKVVRYHLAAFIRGARSVIADPVALKRTLDQVYAYARGPAVSVLDGSLAGKTAWEAVLTVETIPPASDEAMLANPTGLYVVGLSWTRQL